MKIKEILKEQAAAWAPLADEVSDAIPGAFVIPELGNTDTYKQYRYGLAMAHAAATLDPDTHKINPFAKSSAFGEYLTVVTYAGEAERRVIELAAKLMGVTTRQVADTGSHEDKNVGTVSPVPKQK